MATRNQKPAKPDNLINNKTKTSPNIILSDFLVKIQERKEMVRKTEYFDVFITSLSTEVCKNSKSYLLIMSSNFDSLKSLQKS